MTVHTPQPVLILPVSDRDHVQGLPTAPVTLVEYGDYECPYCRKAHLILLRVQQELGDRMRLVFRNFPLTMIHPNAQLAAEAAESASAQGRFWQMHDHLFEYQHQLDKSSLRDYAADLGLNMVRFERDLETHRYSARVHQNFVSGIRSGVNGTPTFFINGVRHSAGWDHDTLLAALLESIERA